MKCLARREHERQPCRLAPPHGGLTTATQVHAQATRRRRTPRHAAAHAYVTRCIHMPATHPARNRTRDTLATAPTVIAGEAADRGPQAHTVARARGAGSPAVATRRGMERRGQLSRRRALWPPRRRVRSAPRAPGVEEPRASAGPARTLSIRAARSGPDTARHGVWPCACPRRRAPPPCEVRVARHETSPRRRPLYPRNYARSGHDV